MFHKWTVFEDIVICSYAMARKTDPKSIKKLSLYLGISESKISCRMNNYNKLIKGKSTDWHYSRQEKKVFNWLNLSSINTIIKIVPRI